MCQCYTMLRAELWLKLHIAEYNWNYHCNCLKFSDYEIKEEKQ